MIESRIRQVAEARGITTAYQLQVALGVVPTVAARLWQAKFTRISLETLDKLCEALDCETSDILVRVKGVQQTEQKESTAKSKTQSKGAPAKRKAAEATPRTTRAKSTHPPYMPAALSSGRRARHLKSGGTYVEPFLTV